MPAHYLDVPDHVRAMDAMNGAPCSHCGEDWYVDVLEVYPEDRAVTFDACCEGSYEVAMWEMQHMWTQEDWQWLFEQHGIEVRTVHTDYARTGGDHWTVDWGLEERSIEQREAFAFIDQLHRHHDAPVGWRWGHAVYNGPDLVAVAVVGRPVARGLDGDTVVEVTRLCVDPRLAPGLVKDACSMLYGAAARTAQKKGYERAVTYTLEEESGHSLKAAGWTPVATTKGGSWSCASRPREDKAPTCPKTRWERMLKPTARARAELAAAHAARRAKRAKTTTTPLPALPAAA
jgi:hypothetical protein